MSWAHTKRKFTKKYLANINIRENRQNSQPVPELSQLFF